MRKAGLMIAAIVVAGAVLWSPSVVTAGEDMPGYLADRGYGVPSSMFGTYIEQGDFVVYTFYEYYYDQDAEYSPADFGDYVDKDYRGKYRAHEGLVFLGYGLTQDLAIELEAAVITATQYKADDDTSAVEPKIEESGLGDVEGQIRWRWAHESAGHPEAFTYFETVFPLQKNKDLIGTPDWEFKLGSGLTKGFHWGTMTLRTAAEYSAEENKVEMGEYAVEYLKRVSQMFRFYIGVEGSQDEVELIADLQFHLFKNGFIRVNNAFGVTSKATDYAPEFGILIRF